MGSWTAFALALCVIVLSGLPYSQQVSGNQTFSPALNLHFEATQFQRGCEIISTRKNNA
jgi:hypothetical protein